MTGQIRGVFRLREIYKPNLKYSMDFPLEGLIFLYLRVFGVIRVGRKKDENNNA